MKLVRSLLYQQPIRAVTFNSVSTLSVSLWNSTVTP